jgi:hypothetical protein
MNKRILVSAAVLAALTAPVGGVQAASILRTVGRHPVSAPLATVNDLQAMMQDMGRDIQAGMAAHRLDAFPAQRTRPGEGGAGCDLGRQFSAPSL